MEDKKMILDMLKEGKITTEEALRLMDAIDSNDSKKKTPHERLFSFDADKAKEGLEELEKNVGGFISNVVNNLFDEDFVLSLKGKYDSFTQRHEIALGEEKKELNILNRNGSVELVPTEDNTIVMESKIFHKNLTVDEESRFFNIIEEDNRISWRVQEIPDLEKKYYVTLKLFVPKEALSALDIETSNASVHVEGIDCETVRLVSKNGRISAKQLNGESLEMASANARLELAQSKLKNADLKTSNGKVTLEEIEADILTVQTSNGRIASRDLNTIQLTLNTSNGTVIGDAIHSERLEEGRFTCSNGKIVLELKDVKRPVDLDLNTTMGTIDLQLPLSLVYESSPAGGAQRSVKATSPDYELGNGMAIFARTSNGSIILK